MANTRSDDSDGMRAYVGFRLARDLRKKAEAWRKELNRGRKKKFTLTDLLRGVFAYSVEHRVSWAGPPRDEAALNAALWGAINDYATACGGDTSEATAGAPRMNAVAAVWRAIEELRRG